MSLCSPRAGLHGGTGLKEAPDYPLVEQQAEQPPSKGTPVDGEEMVFRGCGVHVTRGLGCSVTSQLCIFFLLFDGFLTVLESTSESCRVTQALCRPASTCSPASSCSSHLRFLSASLPPQGLCTCRSLCLEGLSPVFTWVNSWLSLPWGSPPLIRPTQR